MNPINEFNIMRSMKVKENSSWRKKYVKDVIIAIVVVLLPFLIYTHLLFDPDAKFIDLLGYTFEHGYDGNSTFMWYLLVKVIPILLLVIWFLNSLF